MKSPASAPHLYSHADPAPFYLQEQTTVPSLRKALKDVAMEKDAAVVARVMMLFACNIVYFVLAFRSSLLHSQLTFSIGGSCSSASFFQETSERSGRRTIQSMKVFSVLYLKKET